MKMGDGGFRPAYNVQYAVAGSPLGGPRTVVGGDGHQYGERHGEFDPDGQAGPREDGAPTRDGAGLIVLEALVEEVGGVGDDGTFALLEHLLGADLALALAELLGRLRVQVDGGVLVADVAPKSAVVMPLGPWCRRHA